MYKIIVEENVNIYKFPENVSITDENTACVVGDLHGNFIRFLITLLKQGIATNLNKADFDALVLIYQKLELTQMDLDTVDAILDRIHFNKIPIVLIGDELADRGSNDVFTLKLLKKLHEKKVPVEIILSNHSLEFVLACEQYASTGHFKPPILQREHANSLINLNDLVEKKLVKAEEVLSFAKNIYHPKLKLLSYALNEDNSKIVIFSHAAIGLDTIRGLARQFGLDYHGETALELAKTMDCINSKFQAHIKNGTLNTLCPYADLFVAYCGQAVSNPLIITLWNRGYSTLDRPNHVIFVHGHDKDDPRQHEPHIINLDYNNELGKNLFYMEGKYVVMTVPNYKNYTLDFVKFDNLISKLELTAKRLKEKANKQKSYKKVGQAAEQLLNQLATEKLNYQDNAHKMTPIQFKNACETAINAAEPEFKKHRGIWFKHVHPIVRAIIGVLATITIVPALIVAMSSSYGYKGTFFKTPDTSAQVALEEFKNDFSQVVSLGV